MVAAAGRGERMGSHTPKQYLALGGRTIIEHTLATLLAHPRIAGVLVVLAADDALWPGITELNGKPVRTATGGATRSASVMAGLHALPTSVAAHDFVLIHDAARPCVRKPDIDRLIERAGQHEGGLLAVPVRDTLKRANADQCSVATESRESLWRAFTPQMFRRGALTKALQDASSAGIEVTDEAMAMERAGFTPLLVEGAADNLKLTTTEDLAEAEWLLSRIPASEGR